MIIAQIQKAGVLCIKIVYLTLLVLIIFANNETFFHFSFQSRKWLWYLLGFVTLLLLLALKKFKPFLKGGLPAKNALPIMSFIAFFGLVYVFHNPQVTKADAQDFLGHNMMRFEEMDALQYLIFSENPAFSRLTFTNTAKSFYWLARDSADNFAEVNSALERKIKAVENTVSTFTYDFEIYSIAFSRGKIVFQFQGIYPPIIVKTVSALGESVYKIVCTKPE